MNFLVIENRVCVKSNCTREKYNTYIGQETSWNGTYTKALLAAMCALVQPTSKPGEESALLGVLVAENKKNELFGGQNISAWS